MQQTTKPATPQFTGKEAVIAQYLSEGLCSKEIAEKLSISLHTVNNHRCNLLRKFNVSSTAALIKHYTAFCG